MNSSESEPRTDPVQLKKRHPPISDHDSRLESTESDIVEQVQNDVQHTKKKLYGASLTSVASNNLLFSFFHLYAVDLGSTPFTQSIITSPSQLGNTVLQPVWGATSDRVRNTKAFVAFGLMTGLLVVYMFLWAATPIEMILLYAIQSILFSIQIPTWLSLVGGLMDESNRGDELGKLGLATNIASFTATLISGN